MSVPNDPGQVVDDQTYEFLAEQMGITFPSPPPTEFLRDRSRSVPTMIYPAAASLLSAEAIGLYCKLRIARGRGKAMDIDTAAEALDGDEERTWALLDELASIGCVIAPEYAQMLEDERAALMESNRAAVKAARKARLTAPDPFPQYLPQSWSGTRDVHGLDIAAPGRGIAVVYFLCDASGAVLYVGSTGNLAERLAGHRGKPWVCYEARGCPSREAAYWIEAREMLAKLPPLNSPHDNVNGRLPALRALPVSERPSGALISRMRIARPRVAAGGVR